MGENVVTVNSTFNDIDVVPKSSFPVHSASLSHT